MNSVVEMSGRVNFRWNNIISNNFSTFLECFDSRDLWLAIKISRKIEHRTSACRQFHRNRIYFLLSILKLNQIQRWNQWKFQDNHLLVELSGNKWRSKRHVCLAKNGKRFYSGKWPFLKKHSFSKSIYEKVKSFVSRELKFLI